MNLPDDFIFSQSSLQDYADCPRRFELRYLMRQRWPAPDVDDMLEFEMLAGQGERFHHLVHQHLIGLPPELLLRYIDDENVRRWFETYLQNGLTNVPEQRYPETTLTVMLGDTLLLAKFDLLAVEPGQQALIVDWKTSRRLPQRDLMARKLQTIVYRYVLAAGGESYNGGRAIPPEQIEMTYWYADHAGERIQFTYDARQFAADEAYLMGLVREIDTRRTFPLTTDERHCRFCVYRSLCDRGKTAGALAEWDKDFDTGDLSDFTIDLDQIAEIAF